MRPKVSPIIVSNASPGRVRIKVAALYRCEPLRLRLECEVGGLSYVAQVRANVLTASLLVQFDPNRGNATELAKVVATVAGVDFSPVSLEFAQPVPRRESRPSWLSSLLHAVRSKSASRRADPPDTVSAQPTLTASRLGLSAPGESASDWHALSYEQVLGRLNSGMHGLDRQAAENRLFLQGPNALPDPKSRSGVRMFAEQFLNIPVALLGVSAAISVATGGIADAAVIGGVVLLNAVIGYVTEASAERTINALGRMTPTVARVLREGRELEIEAARLVPGDVLVLTPGCYVPADARLLRSNHLTLDESALTGESLPVGKHANRRLAIDSPLGDRVNMLHMGTVVTGGSGLAVVTATGLQTELGRIQSLVGEVSPPDTPMQRQLDIIGVRLVAFCGTICALMFGVGLLRGYGWLQMLGSSISLAVAAVPEGLPAVATTTLALGIRQMQARKVLIRKLPAVESLGSVEVICLDKTGTLTMNEMRVVALDARQHTVELTDGEFRVDGSAFDVLGETELRRLLEVVCLCSEVKLDPENGVGGLDGSPTETAMVQAAIQAGIDVPALRARLPSVHTVHRAEGRPFMLTVHSESDGGYFHAVKGSPVEVLALCDRRRIGDELLLLDESGRRSILQRNDEMAGDGLRVLGVAYLRTDSADPLTAGSLVWLGLIGMEDTVRPGTAELIEQFHGAGIKTVMITGDQSATALSVAKRLGLNRDRPLDIVDSVNLDQLAPEILSNIVRDTTVFSRVTPAHKLRIVQALQRNGKVVAMTGDGVNDGPALKAADVGVALGQRGTDVARSVADVVLEDDNLRTMITAVEQGRTIYNNIRKSLRFLLSTNLSEIEVMLIGTALGWGEALNPMQLLWINLVTDIFPALALSLEPSERDVLAHPPRDPREPIVRRADAAKLIQDSTAISLGCLGVLLYGRFRYGAGALQVGTNTFMTLTLAQFLQAVSCRSEQTTVLDRSRPGNAYLSGALLGSLGLQALTVLLPSLRRLLRLAPITMTDLPVVLCGAVLPFIVNESTKGLRSRGPSEDEMP